MPRLRSWKKIEKFLREGFPDTEVKRNHQRNETLIDLTKSPADLYIRCLDTYREAPEGDRTKLLNYFIEKRLRDLTESIGDF